MLLRNLHYDFSYQQFPKSSTNNSLRNLFGPLSNSFSKPHQCAKLYEGDKYNTGREARMKPQQMWL